MPPPRDASRCAVSDTSRASVALVVIARDEAPRIARLLDSVRPWVDRMLVLDTGSRDDTVQVARARGAQVAHFSWCDDFAAARNAALEAAGADWHLVLDADEWLIDGGPVLRALAGQAADFVGSVHLEDRFFDGAWRTTHIDITRVLPGPVRYAGRVHEQPQHRLPLCRLALRVGHDGYAPERLQAKRGRNRALLQAELAAAQARGDADDGYLWYQLGKDHDVYGEFAQAESCFAAAAARVSAGSPWRFDLAARRLHAFKRIGRHADAMVYADSLLQDCAGSPDFFFALGDMLLDWAAEQPARAGELLPLIEAAWTRCLEIGETPQLHGAVAGRGSHLAAHNLAVVYEGLGRHAQARQLRAAFAG